MSRPHHEDQEGVPAENLRTVLVSDRDVQAAARVLRLIAAGEPHDRGAGTVGPTNASPTGRTQRSVWQTRASQMYADRARRSKIFKNIMFAEAAWDMLLVLYATDQAKRHTVSALISYSATTQTTGLRWLKFLENEGLVTRKPNPLDRRVIWIELADKARELLDTYFAETPGQDIVPIPRA